MILTKQQEANLVANAKAMIEAKKGVEANLNNLIKEAQKIGYIVSPKTGEVRKSLIIT
jgi:hypothetical protein